MSLIFDIFEPNEVNLGQFQIEFSFKKLTVRIFFFVLPLSDKVLELIRLNLAVGAKGGMGGERADLKLKSAPFSMSRFCWKGTKFLQTNFSNPSQTYLIRFIFFVSGQSSLFEETGDAFRQMKLRLRMAMLKIAKIAQNTLTIHLGRLVVVDCIVMIGL